MVTTNKFYGTLICLLTALTVKAVSLTTIRSGSWYDPTIWDKGAIPTKWDKATIAVGTTVTVFGPYTDCDSLIINGFLDVGATNLTIGGRDLQIDVRAVRNTECIINGKLKINGDWDHQFKVYGNVKFNTGSIFEMTAGAVMIDGCAFTEALSVPAAKPLLDVTDAATFSATGGVITLFNPHYHPTGLTIKGAKTFHSVSFGNNISLATFACRNTSDFILSETDKPNFNAVRLAYLPHPNRQNKVIFNNITIPGNLEMTSGVLTGAGRLKIGGNILIGAEGKIEMDIECNHTWQQNISTYLSNTSAVIKGNVYINNPDRVLIGINLEIKDGKLYLIKGKFDLNEKTLTLNQSPEGGSAVSYVLSHNWFQKSGTLKIKNISGNTIFPVGTENSYVPVTLTGTGDFSVIVKPLNDYNPLGINVQWQINQLVGTAPAHVQVQWNAPNEGAAFKNIRPNCRLHRFENNTWIPVSGYGATTQNNGIVFTKTIQNVSSFSTFTLQTSIPTFIVPKESPRRGNIEGLRENPIGLIESDSKNGALSEMVVYPNPMGAENILNVHLNNDYQQNTEIIIFNMNHQLVYQNTFLRAQDLKIPVAHLVQGIYLMQMRQDGQLFHHTFIKP